jgi:hypothetical protein
VTVSDLVKYANLMAKVTSPSDDACDEPDEEPEPPALETTSSYIKMLQSLEELAIFRQNEPDFSQLSEIVRQVRSKLQLEQTKSMKEQTLDSFFHSSKTSRATSVEVIDMSASPYDSDANSSDIMSLE